MSTSSPVALIFGAGKNIGAGVAKAFSAEGYKIATVSRTATTDPISNEGRLHIQSDLSDPNGVPGVFETVRKHLGHPSVVVYNCAAISYMNKEDPLKIPLNDAIHDMNINTLSALAAAKEAVVSFEALPKGAARTFIFTGNILNAQLLPPLMSAGMGKSATAHMIETATEAYRDRGYRFYYADQRKDDGTPAYNAIDGDAHGKFYVELSEKRQGPWLATFVKGKGYVDFSSGKNH